MAKPKPPARVTLSELAVRYGYSFNALKTWKFEGLPYDEEKKSCDEAAATKWIIENKINPLRNMSVKDEMEKAKLREQNAKADMAEYAARKESGVLIETEFVQQALNQYLQKFKDVIRIIPVDKANEIMEAAVDIESTKIKLREILNNALIEIGDLLVSDDLLDSIAEPDTNDVDNVMDNNVDNIEQNGIELDY